MERWVSLLVMMLVVFATTAIWGYWYTSIRPFIISKRYFNNSIYDEIKEYHLKFKECGINHIFQKFGDGFMILIRGEGLSRFSAIQCSYNEDRQLSVLCTRMGIDIKLSNHKISFEVWQTLDTREWVIAKPIYDSFIASHPMPFSGICDVKNLLEIGGIYNCNDCYDLMICGFSEGESRETMCLAAYKCANDLLDGKFNKEVR